MSIWYDKDDEDRMWIYVDILEKGITMTMSHWEFQSFVQNLEMANFKLSKVKEIEIEESCDCDQCVTKRKGQQNHIGLYPCDLQMTMNMEKIYELACNQLDQVRSSYAVLESLKDGFNDGLIFKIQCDMDESYEEAKVLVSMIEDELPNRGDN